MRIAFPIIILLAVLFGKGNSGIEYRNTKPSLNETLDRSPEFFVLEWKGGTKLFPKKTDFFIEIDSVGKQDVVVLLNNDKEPVLYSSEIATPVCADGECKLMNIKLYWTLLGEYAGFDRYPELPLTKHDHNEFLKEDYQKLHDLLVDDKSIFGRRSIDRLVEKPIMRTVNGVDALSGATIAEVKESVVSGALYSCYTAWHLVHGDIRENLKANTLSVLNDNMLIDMLYSKNANYHLFSLDELDDIQYTEHYLQIAEVFKTSTPLVRGIIAKRFIKKFGNSPDLQKPFWEAFVDVDLGARSLLLEQLDAAPEFASEKLSNKLHLMSKNQLRTFLGYLSTKKTLDPKVHAKLRVFADSGKDTFAYLANNYLEDLNE